MFGSINNFAKNYPRFFSFAFTGAKACAADLIVQKFVEHKKDIDWKRNSVFLGFGCFYMGGVQYVFYVDVLKRIFPRAGTFAAQSLREKARDTKGQLAVVGQTVLEQFVHTPLAFFPAYYITREAVLGDPEERQGKGVVAYSMEHYINNFKMDMFADMSIWIPSHIINFCFMPMHLRVPWVAVTSFGYTMVLSFMRGERQPHPEMEKVALVLNTSTKGDGQPLSIDYLAPVVQDAIKQFADSDKALTRDGFRHVFRKLGVEDDTAVNVLFELFDLDHSGKVSQTEFITALLAICGRGASQQRLENMFAICDFNHDLKLDHTEVETVVNSLLMMRDTLTVGGKFPRRTQSGPIESRGAISSAVQAKKITERIFEDVKPAEKGSLTKTEFLAWAASGSETAKELLMVFESFERLHK